jgi:acyl-CoA synthetase (AMP-forming)/AMP-acid ligase II
MYTSGTTGRAKGVLHSYNTLEAEVRTAAETWRLDRGDVVLMPSPLTHITGYLYGMGFPTSLGMNAVLMDRWNAESALELIETHAVNCIVAATPFLKELADAARRSRRRLPSLRVFACGGAPVAPEIVRNAMEAFENCAVFRVYGSTEAPTITLGSLTDKEVAAATDGYVVGHDVKIVDEQGHTLPPGEEGEILTCGPEVMLGYKRLEDNQDAFDSEGYFRTGDLGVLRPDNALVITGRKKDLIIRGGENLSAKEIEDVLYENPAVQEVAIVATPHERLGEGVCAVIVPAEGHQLTLADITAFLSARGLARQKFPERLEVVEALPRTASGKIQKYVLREWLKHGTPPGEVPGPT